MTSPSVTICGVLDRVWSPDQLAEIDHVFFSSSATQEFASPADRAVFRERWLGRYLLGDAAHAFVAMGAGDRIVGYVVGTIEDPARDPRFGDISTTRTFAAASSRYPAHLHINVAQEMRGRGLGAQLIEVFAAHASTYSAPGLHVITNAASRNVRFYERCGFDEIDRVTIGANEIVFLGRALLRV